MEPKFNVTGLFNKQFISNAGNVITGNQIAVLYRDGGLSDV